MRRRLRAGRAWGAATLLALLVGCAREAPPAVVLIVIDTLRWDRLSLAGYDRPTSPHLDAFAADATVFARAFAPASWTRPSVASLLTGLDPRHHGAIHWDQALGDVETLATRLQRAGYRTRAFVSNPFLGGSGFEKGFDRYEVLSKGVGWSIRGRDVNRAVFESGPVEPGSFVYVHYVDPHDPYDPDPKARELLVRPYDGEADGSMEFLRGPLVYGRFEPTPDDVRYLSDLYDADVRTADAALGELLAWLRRTGAYDRSVVIVTSDHGEELLEHGGWLHGMTLFDEQLHVPLIIKPRAGSAAPGVRRDEVALVDVVPTVLELAGLDADPELAGRSLVPLDRPHPDGGPRTLFALEPLSDGVKSIGMARAVRRHPLKWIRVEGRYPRRNTPWPGECFDLDADPGEQTSLADLGPGPCADLASALEAWRAEGIREGADLEVDEHTRSRLEALGYLH